MSALFFLFCVLMPAEGLPDNRDLHIRITKSSFDQTKSNACFEMELSSDAPEPLTLASQNYRLYYDAGNLSLSDDDITLLVPEGAYQLRVIQNLSHLDASGIGPLSFEADLGFANFSIVYQEGNKNGVNLTNTGGWIKIAQLCFDIADTRKPANIVLARDHITAKYGKAFIEVSAYDENRQITAPKIKSYSDFSASVLSH